MASPRLRAFRSRLLLGALNVVTFFGRRLSLRSAQRTGSAIGGLAWHLARGERRKALRNIALAFPEWTPRQCRDAIRAMFRHLGTSLLEIVWLPNLNRDDVLNTTTVEGMERSAELIGAGRTLVAMSGHCGNWEWLAYWVGLRLPVMVMQRERAEPGLNDFIVQTRLRAGVRTIDRGSTTGGRELIQSLRRPGIVAFLVDQNIRTESVKVPFFGMPALTPIGPAKLAIRTGAAVLPIFIERRADGTHHIRLLEPIETSRDDDPIELTARATRIIEEQIRRAPEQWVWMHERWRERPKWDIAQQKNEP